MTVPSYTVDFVTVISFLEQNTYYCLFERSLSWQCPEQQHAGTLFFVGISVFFSPTLNAALFLT
jgi:hypothetical protein